MATIPELLDGHVTLEVECLDRLYLNGYISRLATALGLALFMKEQLGKPVPSPVVLGQLSEKFREPVTSLAERESIPVYQFRHKERKDDMAKEFRRQRQIRDGIVCIGVAQEKVQAFNLTFVLEAPFLGWRRRIPFAFNDGTGETVRVKTLPLF